MMATLSLSSIIRIEIQLPLCSSVASCTQPPPPLAPGAVHPHSLNTSRQGQTLRLPILCRAVIKETHHHNGDARSSRSRYRPSHPEALASQMWIFVGDASDLEWPGEVVGL